MTAIAKDFSKAVRNVHCQEAVARVANKTGYTLARSYSQILNSFGYNIGSIRFDPLAGWIADQGIVRLRDANSKRVVAQFQAKGSFITPTVENIISKLVTKIKKTY